MNQVQQEEKILYDEDKEEGGWWAYLETTPTTRTFGETKPKAFAHLIQLLFNERSLQ